MRGREREREREREHRNVGYRSANAATIEGSWIDRAGSSESHTAVYSSQRLLDE